ncbi:ribonuclease H-like domain-containing protein [Aspergillus ambiguus]|uniref:3'-5' exonuclease n=1 Tax=Aspergillus ambiguus TaxID=176160 RepID=UPI003CCE4C94
MWARQTFSVGWRLPRWDAYSTSPCSVHLSKTALINGPLGRRTPLSRRFLGLLPYCSASVFEAPLGESRSSVINPEYKMNCGSMQCWRTIRQNAQLEVIPYNLNSWRKECARKLKHVPAARLASQRRSYSLNRTRYLNGLVMSPASSPALGSSRSSIRTSIFRELNSLDAAWKQQRCFSASIHILSERTDDVHEETVSRSDFVEKPHTSTSPDPQKSSTSPANFWSHQMYKRPDGGDITVHYCKSLKSAEDVAKHFLQDEVLGFDLEWKAQASAFASIQNNVSLVQVANRERIALFHIAMFRPATGIDDLVPPSLREILESPRITKVGVSIKADSTRVRKYLGINARAIFELSHLHKLVKYCYSDPRLINKRLVNLSDQVEEHFGLPLAKESDVRCGDWTHALTYRQVQYAASDPYACVCLFYAMDAKRKALDPIPPLPAHAELDIPIRIVRDAPVQTDPDEVEVVRTAGGPVAKTIS